MRRNLAIAAASLIAAALLWWWLGGEAPPGGGPDQTSSPGAEDPRPAAQGPLAIATPAPVRTATSSSLRALFGFIRSADGSAVAGATVRAIDDRGAELEVESGDDGGYLLPALPARVARLEVWAEGFAPQQFEQPSFPDRPRVRWDVTLEPAGGVFGLVLAAGKPVPGAYVRLQREGSDHALDRARSDAGGRFALDLDEAGGEGLRVEAWHAQHGRAVVPVDGPGEVTLELPGGGFVEGTVRDTEGRPITSFMASASSLGFGDSGPAALAFEGDSGSYRLGPIAPGKQRVSVVAAGYRPGRSRAVQVASGATVKGVDFALDRSAVLEGRVTDAITKAPIEGALVAPAEWSADALAEAAGAVTGPDGRYSLRSLPGGRTTIAASARGYRPLMHGGVEAGRSGNLSLDFALTPTADGESPRGELIGIGATLQRVEQGIEVVSLVGGSPAQGRLQERDLIVMVGDRSVLDLPFGEVVQQIRGEAGTEVVLWVLRGGTGDPERITLERRRVEMPHPHRRQ